MKKLYSKSYVIQIFDKSNMFLAYIKDFDNGLIVTDDPDLAANFNDDILANNIAKKYSEEITKLNINYEVISKQMARKGYGRLIDVNK